MPAIARFGARLLIVVVTLTLIAAVLSLLYLRVRPPTVTTLVYDPQPRSRSNIFVSAEVSGASNPVLSTFVSSGVGLPGQSDIDSCTESIVLATARSYLLPRDRSVRFVDPVNYVGSDWTTISPWSGATTQTPAGFKVHTEYFLDTALGVMALIPVHEDALGSCLETSEDLTFWHEKMQFERADTLIEGLQPLSSTPAYYFPFDTYWLPFSAQHSVDPEPKLRSREVYDESGLTFQVLQMEGPSISPITNFQISSTEWEVGLRTEATRLIEMEYPVLEFSRPFSTIALFYVIFSILIGSVVCLVFVSSTSTVVEVMIVLVFGLWGVKPLLVPEALQSKTIVDEFILALYVLIPLALIVRYTAIPLWRRTGRQAAATPQSAEDGGPEVPSVKIEEDVTVHIRSRNDIESTKARQSRNRKVKRHSR